MVYVYVFQNSRDQSRDIVSDHLTLKGPEMC